MVPSFVDQLGVAHPWPIQVFDVTSPSSPLEIAVLQTPGGGRVAAPGPGLVVVADGPAGISVYESCVPFADGFESGDAAAWSDTRP